MNSNSDQPLPTIAILAPGLLGASLAAASKANRLCARVHVWARREETRKQCQLKDWCDECFETAEAAVAQADIVWICAPVASIARLVAKLEPHLKPGAIVSDVGSTKAKLIAQCEQCLGNRSFFVGSHPMAGSEKSGLEYADKNLYKGRPCFVTPSAFTDSNALDVIETYWKALGMQVYRVTPKEHDHIVAMISHLPHLVAATLASKLAQKGGTQWRQFVGSGLLDTTRVAAGSVPMWMDILDHNRDEILSAISLMIDGLEHLREHLRSGRYEAVEQLLIEGKAFREMIEPGKKPL